MIRRKEKKRKTEKHLQMQSTNIRSSIIGNYTTTVCKTSKILLSFHLVSQQETKHYILPIDCPRMDVRNLGPHEYVFSRGLSNAKNCYIDHFFNEHYFARIQSKVEILFYVYPETIIFYVCPETKTCHMPSSDRWSNRKTQF